MKDTRKYFTPKKLPEYIYPKRCNVCLELNTHKEYCHAKEGLAKCRGCGNEIYIIFLKYNHGYCNYCKQKASAHTQASKQ